VPPLIELSRSGDPALTARVARIIGDIGGPEAEGYLLTLEAGHPDPRVRTAAREALEELAARARDRQGSVAARK
jgi:HEAT repeat protein